MGSRMLFDTSVYIPLLRDGRMPLDIAGSMVFLSSVVAQELYAGAVDRATQALLDDLVDAFERNGRIVTPGATDWLSAGKALSQIGRRHGFDSIKKGRLVNDVLIALGCRAMDATLITSNHHDFGRIHEFVKFTFVGVP